VVLEKVRAQGDELRALKGKAKAGRKQAGGRELPIDLGEEVHAGTPIAEVELRNERLPTTQIDELRNKPLTEYGLEVKPARPDAVKQAEAALKALREARDPAARRRAAEALEQAAKQLRGQPAKPAPEGNPSRHP
jgi:hypothetical protein